MGRTIAGPPVRPARAPAVDAGIGKRVGLGLELLSPRLDPRRVHRPLDAGDLDLDPADLCAGLLPVVAAERRRRCGGAAPRRAGPGATRGTGPGRCRRPWGSSVMGPPCDRAKGSALARAACTGMTGAPAMRQDAPMFDVFLAARDVPLGLPLAARSSGSAFVVTVAGFLWIRRITQGDAEPRIFRATDPRRTDGDRARDRSSRRRSPSSSCWPSAWPSVLIASPAHPVSDRATRVSLPMPTSPYPTRLVRHVVSGAALMSVGIEALVLRSPGARLTPGSTAGVDTADAGARMA